MENLRIKEAATYLGINKATLLRYVNAGKIPSFKISPRVILVKKIDLDEFINKGATNG